MSAPNQSESPREDAGKGHKPVLTPGNRSEFGSLDIVWSSPVITGAGLGDALRRSADPEAPPQPEAAADWNRCIYAFESDLLDSAFVHWETGNDALTLEMIPGFKKDPAEDASTYPAQSLASGLGDLIAESPHEFITRLDSARGDSVNAGLLTHFQPDISAGTPGPSQVRNDGIEDPLTGWRPTGMVFFETLATPPRGTIYSSTLLDAFLNGETPVLITPPAPLTAEVQHAQDASPFFDFPEAVLPAPAEQTDDFPMEIVVKGRRSGGGGGFWIFKFMGRMVLIVMALVGLFALILGGSYVNYIKQRLYDSKVENRFVTVIIKPGDSFRTVIDRMHAEGVLKGYLGLDDRFLMRYLAYAYENSSKIKPGVYKFDTGQDLQDIYDRMITGSKDFKITIPEGKTAEEIGKTVASQYTNFKLDRFMTLVNDPIFISQLGIDAPSLEGYLYPSTYYFGPGMKEEELIKLMVGTFQNKVKTELADKMTSDGLTFHQHVIMASLIEREARMDEDRPLIASVIFNRMTKGMPLQIDATVNFALKNWRRLTNNDYKIQSPYNTYLFKGLPPGPIASPRIESLSATFEAPQTDYYYYVHKGDGHHAFAETYAQHLANVGRYIRQNSASSMGNAPSDETGITVQDEAATESKEPALAGTITIEVPSSTAVSTSKDSADNSGKPEKSSDIKSASPAVDKKEPARAESTEEASKSESATGKEAAKPKSY